LLLSYGIDSPGQAGNLARGFFPVDNTARSGFIEYGHGRAQSLVCAFLLFAFHSGPYAFYNILDARAHHAVSGIIFQALSVPFFG
jgi:hypothetical protein